MVSFWFSVKFRNQAVAEARAARQAQAAASRKQAQAAASRKKRPTRPGP
jgi:high-affinity K+ transport system ATPase subunit B